MPDDHIAKVCFDIHFVSATSCIADIKLIEFRTVFVVILPLFLDIKPRLIGEIPKAGFYGNG